MIVKDKYGNDCNLDYIYAIEIGLNYPSENNIIYWSRWSKYKTQRAMLQALVDLRRNELAHVGKSWKTNGLFGVKIMSYWYYRPVHVTYHL